MRRHTTKDPSGPETSAMPQPPTKARIMKSSSTKSPMAVPDLHQRHDFPSGIVVMVMTVLVDGQRFGVAAEQRQIFRMTADILRMPGAADMPVDADDGVGARHHQMQVVGNQQDTATASPADLGDQVEQLDLAMDVHCL